MALTRDYRETVVNRIRKDPEFAVLLLERALQALFFERDLVRARSILRDLVHGTITFPVLAERMGKKPPSVFRMLGDRGHPRIENLLEIVAHLCAAIGARAQVTVQRMPWAGARSRRSKGRHHAATAPA